jgi:hypothetical protein
MAPIPDAQTMMAQFFAGEENLNILNQVYTAIDPSNKPILVYSILGCLESFIQVSRKKTESGATGNLSLPKMPDESMSNALPPEFVKLAEFCN